MKKNRTLLIIILLAALSAAIYFIQFLLFHDFRDTAFYMFQDWAFLPIQVALVTIIAGTIVSEKEKESRMEKTRMLASSFFSDVGADFLEKLKPAVKNAAEIAPYLEVGTGWTKKDYEQAAAALKNAPLTVACSREDLEELKKLLTARKMSMLVISSNPVLLEHEDFTDMLWAIFHMTDELMLRDLSQLSAADAAHLDSDAQRAVRETLINWVRHMEHLQKEYPYLYQLEAYRNPFISRSRPS